MKEKLERVKLHLKEHKREYIVGGICFAAGLVVAGKAYQINYKSPGATNIFVEAPKRLGHPGNIIRDKSTGMVYASQNAAAKALNINKFELSEHVRGIRPDVNGHTFEILGEAVA